jgi:hypothetical protein
MMTSKLSFGTVAPFAGFVSPDEARFSASIQGLCQSQVMHGVQTLAGGDPGYSTRKGRAEFRETGRVEEAAAQTRETPKGWSS